MPDVLVIIVLTLGAGLCIPLGGVLASIEHISPRWLEQEFRHFMMASAADCCSAPSPTCCCLRAWTAVDSPLLASAWLGHG